MEFPVFDIRSVIIGFLATGGGATAIAYLAFKHFSVSWLESKFSQRLESFRHENNKEIENFKFEIDGAMRARQRYQEKQFESVVETWRLFRVTAAQIANAISYLQSYPNIASMSSEMKQEYLATFDLLEAQRKEILAAPNIQESFHEVIDRINFNKAATSYNDLNEYLRAREIFIDTETVRDFKDIVEAMRYVLQTKQIYAETNSRQLSASERNELHQEIGKYNLLIEEITARLTAKIRRRYGDDNIDS